jgi:hypothetical protein
MSLIHCKNLCKCCNYPTQHNNKKRRDQEILRKPYNLKASRVTVSIQNQICLDSIQSRAAITSSRTVLRKKLGENLNGEHLKILWSPLIPFTVWQLCWQVLAVNLHDQCTDAGDDE